MTDAPPPSDEAPDAEPEAEETAIEEIARKKMGLRSWDRPALFRETAEAAVDTDLPFWAVLFLSGAIATLGLLLNQTAVVIGAMLVAPLLGPLLGLSMALAIGDGRLAVHTAAAVLLGALGVIALAATLTWLLPFQDVTPEILARTRPTTLDLAIAVFSGLAGAVVTVSRETRLSASIPGVAIAVALIPPLGVAGFGIATGTWAFVRGSLLLFGANLGGIVIMGMLTFLAVGMHRPGVREVARTWHARETQGSFGDRVTRLPGLRRIGVMRSAWARVALVGAFVGAVAVPLSRSLGQVLREGRVTSAVAGAVASIEADDRASVLSREVVLEDARTLAELRVATTAWISDDERRLLAEAASAAAGEPIDLRLEQVLASRGNLDDLADMLPSTVAPVPARAPVALTSLDAVRARIVDVLDGLAVPDSVAVLGAEVGVGDGPPALTVVYASRRRLSADAEAILAEQAAQALGLPRATTRPVRLGPRALPRDSTEAARLGASLSALARRYSDLRLVLRADSARIAQLRPSLRELGSVLDVRRDSVASLALSLR